MSHIGLTHLSCLFLGLTCFGSVEGSDGEEDRREEHEQDTGIGREILWGPDGPTAGGGFLT